MSVSASTLRRLAALNLAPQAMAEVLSIIADLTAVEEARKAKDRARKFRGDSVEIPRNEAGKSTDVSMENPVPHAGARAEPETTNSSEPLKNKKQEKIGLAPDRSFDEVFWPRYPNKVGKPAAKLAWDRARKAHTAEQIMAGLDRYVRSKPPDRPWLNPATFLNQERFNDQPAGGLAPASSSPTELPKWQGPPSAPRSAAPVERPDGGVLPQGSGVHPEPQAERRGPVLRNQPGHRGMVPLGGVLSGILRGAAPRDADGGDGQPEDVHRPGPVARMV